MLVPAGGAGQNGDVYVSDEMIAIVVSAATLMLGVGLALTSGFAWMIRRPDAQFERLGDRLSGVERELVEIKIAVARIEGPPRRLLSVR